jgi:hypothetical protein
LHYRPHGKSLGRPLKRWSETITGHWPDDDDDEICNPLLCDYITSLLKNE